MWVLLLQRLQGLGAVPIRHLHVQQDELDGGGMTLVELECVAAAAGPPDGEALETQRDFENLQHGRLIIDNQKTAPEWSERSDRTCISDGAHHGPVPSG